MVSWEIWVCISSTPKFCAGLCYTAEKKVALHVLLSTHGMHVLPVLGRTHLYTSIERKITRPYHNLRVNILTYSYSKMISDTI